MRWREGQEACAPPRIGTAGPRKLRFTLMLPQLARCILSEFGTMYVELQVAVDALPIATVTGPLPPSPL